MSIRLTDEAEKWIREILLENVVGIQHYAKNELQDDILATAKECLESGVPIRYTIPAYMSVNDVAHVIWLDNTDVMQF